ncbi:MAG: branched-chain amino acid ABC transporter substrate-binding protein, partial [Pseudonocardia sp.]|nr:branched-chain amino acid ABC transporter substrate-binding protein [Pseudonocardia sp.]
SPKSAFVISDDQEYSVGIADYAAKGFQAANVPIQRDKFAQGASDYSSTVSKVKAANPDVIFYGGYYAQAGRLLKQLRDGGVTATFATGDGSLDAGLISGAGQQAAEGAIVGCPCNIPFGSTDPKLKKFSDDYKAKFNADPAIYSTEGYDAATAFIKAVQAGKTDGPSINDFFTTLSFDGVSKPVKWTSTGELDTTTIYVYEVKGGKINLLGPTDKAQLS